jgi:hypothetical protein
MINYSVISFVVDVIFLDKEPDLCRIGIKTEVLWTYG